MSFWGQLWEFPFLTPVWGTVSSWFGALSFAAGVAYFVLGRRQDARGQASLISVTRAGTLVTVHNQSDQPIGNLSASAKILGLWRTVKRDDFQGIVIMGSPTPAQFPSHQFYLNARQTVKNMKDQVARLTARLKDDKTDLPANATADMIVAGLGAGGVVNYVHFRDARGVDWSIDILSLKLKRVKKKRHPFRWLWSAVRTAWWIGINMIISGWNAVFSRGAENGVG